MFPESYMTSSANKQSSWGPLGGGDCTQKPPAQTKVEEPAHPGSTIDGDLGVRSQPSAGQMKKQLAARTGPLSSRMGVLRELPVCPCPQRGPTGRADPAWQKGVVMGSAWDGVQDRALHPSPWVPVALRGGPGLGEEGRDAPTPASQGDGELSAG